MPIRLLSSSARLYLAELFCERDGVGVVGVSPSCCVGRKVQGPPLENLKNKDAKSCILTVILCKVDTCKLYAK
jgi:hypothetical protein